MELKNAVGIVTGSAVGIGAACALALAKKGCHTVINFTKSETEAAATARECEKFGVQTLLVRGDVAEDADCRNLAEQALKKWGRIDALVNNAGISKFAPDHRNLEALQAGDFQKDLCRQCHRGLSNGAGRGAGYEEAGSRGNREYLLHCRRHGGRVVGGLCGLQRRPEYDDPITGQGSGARNPCQCRLPRLCRDPLVEARVG